MNQFLNFGRVVTGEITHLDRAERNFMEKKIADLKGKRIEVNCGNGIAFTGENLGQEDGVLTLECEGKKRLYIDAAKIVVLSEASDTVGKPGFIA